MLSFYFKYFKEYCLLEKLKLLPAIKEAMKHFENEINKK